MADEMNITERQTDMSVSEQAPLASTDTQGELVPSEAQSQASSSEPSATLEEPPFEYDVKLEEAGPGAKKVTVQIPPERIKKLLADQFRDLRREAVIPGFRPGHAPQKLVEKRFDKDVRDQVRGTLIRESYEQALSKNSLDVIGEPDFENAQDIKLPTEGPLTYSFQVEVKPEFLLPPVANLVVKRPKAKVTDANVEMAMSNLREQQGTLLPVEGRGVESKDALTANVHIKLDGEVVAHQHDASLISRPGRVGGIQIDDLEQKLQGANVGEKREFTTHVGDDHVNEALRGKDVQIEIEINDIRRLEPAVLDEDFLSGLGFANEQELRNALREQLDERMKFDVEQAMRDQVANYLLQNITLELPAKLSAKQEERVVGRRATSLLMRGIPAEQIEANLQLLRGGAAEEARRELKLFFILQKIAEQQEVDVTEAELNGRIATLAGQRGHRPEKMKQEMSKDGSLADLYVQMREQKALDKILAMAKIEEVEFDESGKPKEPA